MKAALLTALAEGACGEDGRRAVESLARAVGLEAGASVVEAARLVPLGQLTPEHAREMLDLALRIAKPGDRRVTDDSDAAARLARFCGHLPLALQIAAALLVEDPDMPVAELVDELAASSDRLAHLDDGERSVRAAFDLSYCRLQPEEARLLRLLALMPGPEASQELIAALVGTAAPPTQSLKALARAHLIERGSERTRWRMHDLVRAFGASVVVGDAGLRAERGAARDRALDFFLPWAEAANDRLRWRPGDAEPERFADRAQALEWLDGERAALVAAAQWARERRYSDRSVRLVESLKVYLNWRRYFDDLIAVSCAAQQAARRDGDRVGEASACISLGLALGEAGRAAAAIKEEMRARDLYREMGNCNREAVALNNLGNSLREVGRVEEAIESQTRARVLFRAAGDRHREAMACNNLGNALQEAGLLEEAVEVQTQAYGFYRDAGDRHREAMACNNLGLALRKVGRVGDAVEAHNEALRIYREFDDSYREGSALENLAAAYEAACLHAEARNCWLQAADAFTRVNAVSEALAARTAAGDPLTP